MNLEFESKSDFNHQMQKNVWLNILDLTRELVKIGLLKSTMWFGLISK